MSNLFQRLHTTIRSSVITICLFATLVTVALAVGLQYYFGQLIAKDTATELYASAADTVAAELRGMGRININVINLLADDVELWNSNDRAAQLDTFVDVLRQNPLYYGVYVGSTNGEFYEVNNLSVSDQARKFYAAQPMERWLVKTVSNTPDGRVRLYEYLSEELTVLRSRTERTDYDASERPWFISAMLAPDAQLNPPYRFAQTGIPGRTVSKRIEGTQQVVAIDITLGSIAALLQTHQIARRGDIYLFSTSTGLLASSDPDKAAKFVGNAGAAKGYEGPSAEAQQLLATLSEVVELNPEDGQLVDTTLNGSARMAYVTPVGMGGDPIYMGVLADPDVVFSPVLDKVKLAGLLTTGCLLCLLPLSWFFANPIVKPVKQLAGENEKVRLRKFDDVERVVSHVRELDELSESMVAMVDAVKQYEADQQALMESIIKLIAEAIDDKSSHTGGHCERVPVLAMMLAETASHSDLPAFRDFALRSEAEWQEYRIAAWLHDCGKITTPEHIVDKGTKLETIYNRIHEIRGRFEILWRDVEIDYLRRLLEEPDKREELEQELAGARQQLQDDFRFIADCNVGSESLGEDELLRLQQLADITWTRHFDDTLGLSPIETRRLGHRPVKLPVREKLLADKPEHLIPREKSTDYPPEYGINMDIPAYESNLGELYNLCVSRGTLTREDRFRINEHMISTIKMLESVPFPEELKNVPRYASTHHETMKGTGYPRRLTGDMLSIPEKLLAIADVFEALTAADRPYKQAKPVSAAMDILHRMVEDNHLDRDCFELFVKEKVFMRYARTFLPESQIDEVNSDKYLAA